jgi:hypothetical protein
VKVEAGEVQDTSGRESEQTAATAEAHLVISSSEAASEEEESLTNEISSPVPEIITASAQEIVESGSSSRGQRMVMENEGGSDKESGIEKVLKGVNLIVADEKKYLGMSDDFESESETEISGKEADAVVLDKLHERRISKTHHFSDDFTSESSYDDDEIDGSSA